MYYIVPRPAKTQSLGIKSLTFKRTRSSKHYLWRGVNHWLSLVFTLAPPWRKKYQNNHCAKMLKIYKYQLQMLHVPEISIFRQYHCCRQRRRRAEDFSSHCPYNSHLDFHHQLAPQLSPPLSTVLTFRQQQSNFKSFKTVFSSDPHLLPQYCLQKRRLNIQLRDHHLWNVVYCTHRRRDVIGNGLSR